jgi:hypothetical protein
MKEPKQLFAAFCDVAEVMRGGREFFAKGQNRAFQPPHFVTRLFHHLIYLFPKPRDLIQRPAQENRDENKRQCADEVKQVLGGGKVHTSQVYTH